MVGTDGRCDACGLYVGSATAHICGGHVTPMTHTGTMPVPCPICQHTYADGLMQALARERKIHELVEERFDLHLKHLTERLRDLERRVYGDPKDE